MRKLNRLQMTRIVSTEAVLNTAVFPQQTKIRVASDELLLYPAIEGETAVGDPHAIIIQDGSFAGIWLAEANGLAFLAHTCEWELPTERPAFAQGSVAGIATKLVFQDEKILFIVPAPMAHDFEERLS